MKSQKILNNAFYATLVMAGLTLIAFILGFVSANLFGIMEFILFPTLGYFTKRGSKKAVIALLVLFIFDRVMLFVNWSSHLTDMFSIIPAVFISFTLWSYFYKAYLAIKWQ